MKHYLRLVEARVERNFRARDKFNQRIRLTDASEVPDAVADFVGRLDVTVAFMKLPSCTIRGCWVKENKPSFCDPAPQRFIEKYMQGSTVIANIYMRDTHKVYPASICRCGADYPLYDRVCFVSIPQRSGLWGQMKKVLNTTGDKASTVGV